MGAVADKEIPINLHAGIAESRNFFKERNRIENNAVPDDAAAAFAQHPARNQLQDKSLAVNDDGVAGVVSACITGNDGEFLRQHVNDFAFTLVAPLGSYDDGGSALAQTCLLELSLTAWRGGLHHCTRRRRTANRSWGILRMCT